MALVVSECDFLAPPDATCWRFGSFAVHISGAILFNPPGLAAVVMRDEVVLEVRAGLEPEEWATLEPWLRARYGRPAEAPGLIEAQWKTQDALLRVLSHGTGLQLTYKTGPGLIPRSDR